MSVNTPLTLRTLHRLPSAARLRQLCVANAVLDAILMPDWVYRYFSFDAQWSPGEAVGSLRTGSGDHHYVLFCGAGVLIKGLEVGSVLNTPRCPDAEDWRTAAVPTGLRAALSEPAFEMDWISYCLWSAPTGAPWRSGTPAAPDALDAPLGHLHLLVDAPAAYAQWATAYYERPVSLEAVRLVQEHTPLTPQLIQELNPEVTLEDLAEGLHQIGFPLA